jgi:hypothetical protein
MRSYFKTKLAFFLSSFLSFSVLRPMPYTMLPFLNMTVLHYNDFTKTVCSQKKRQSLGRLMHSAQCGSSVLPYEMLDGRPAQGTLMGCANCIHIKNQLERIEHSTYIQSRIYLYICTKIEKCKHWRREHLVTYFLFYNNGLCLSN